MITVLRSKIKTSGMTYIVWISLISMFIGSIMPSLFKKNTSEPWAIKINNESIPYALFMQTMNKNKEYIQRLRAQYGQFADYFLHSMGAHNAQSLTFKQLITRELLTQAMKRTEIAIGQEYIGYKLNDQRFLLQYCADIMPVAQVTTEKGINSKALRVFLQQHHIPVELFQKQLTEKVEQQFFNALTSTFSYIPDYLNKYNTLQQTGKKSFIVLNVKHDAFLKEVSKTPLTESEIKNFFERENAQSKRYQVPQKRNGILWEFTPKNYGTIVDQEVIEKYYEQHKVNRYIDKPAQLTVRKLVIDFTPETKQEAYRTAQHLHTQLVENPDQFIALVREYSTDAESAKADGQVPPFSRGQQEGPFDRAAFILKQDGDISPVIALEKSFVIIQRIAKAPQTYKPLIEVTPEIEQELSVKEFEKTFIQEVKRAIDTNDSTVMDQFAKEHKGVASSLTQVTQSEKRSAQALFERKEPGYTFYIDDKKGYVVALTAIEPAYIPTLEAVKSVVKTDIYQERASTLMQEFVESIKKESQEKPILIVAAEHAIPVEHLKNIVQTDGTAVKNIRTKGLNPHALFGMEKIGSWLVQPNGFDRYMIYLENITPENGENEQVEKTQKEYHEQQYNAFMSAFIASLYRDATIDINNAITMITEENAI